MVFLRQGAHQPTTPSRHHFEYEGDLSVLQALQHQAHLARQGKSDPTIRVVLCILGGSMRGVYGGGHVQSLHNAHLTDGFEAVVGVSAGAPTAAYFLAGMPEVGTSIFTHECASRTFIDPTRLHKGTMLDVHYLEQVFRGHGSVPSKKLNVSALKAARPALRIAATNYATGKGVLFDGKDLDDPVTAIIGSCAMPVAYSHSHYMVRGIRCVDAAIGIPFPLTEVLTEFDPTHILIFPNRHKFVTFEYDTSAFLHWIEVALTARLPMPLRTAVLMRHRHVWDTFTMLRSGAYTTNAHTRLNYLIVWPDDSVGPLTIDQHTLLRAETTAREFTNALIRTGLGLKN